MSDTRLRFLGSALAGVVLVGWMLHLARGKAHEAESSPVPTERPSDAPPLEILEPKGTVPHWSLFRWLGEAPAGGGFQVRVWNAEWPESAPVLERRTGDSFWMPNEMERIELPERMLWQVRALDENGWVKQEVEGRAQLEVTQPTEGLSETPDETSSTGDDPTLAELEAEGDARDPDIDAWFELAVQSDREGAGDEALQALRTAFDDYREAWGKTADHPGERGFLLHTKRRAALNSLVHLEATLGADDAGRERALVQLYRAQCTDATGTPPPDFETARKHWTANDTLVLAFVPGRQRISVLGFDAKRSFYATLPLQREYERTRRKLQAAVTAPLTAPGSEDDLRSHAKLLSELLLPPQLGSLLDGVRHLTIAGSNLLGYVPFELLPLPSGERLEERCAISYLDALPRGAQILSRPDEELTWARELGLLFAVPLDEGRHERWPELEPIPHASENRELLRSGLRAGQIEMLEGRSADRFALARCALNARTLHMYVHAVRLEDGRTPALLVAPTPWNDGLLASDDLGEFRFPPLVRISIAGTVEQGWDGAAAAEFSTTLLDRGAETVLITPRPLTAASIEGITPALHRGLFEEKRTIAEAVRRARASLRPVNSQENPESTSLRTGLMHIYGAGTTSLGSTDH